MEVPCKCRPEFGIFRQVELHLTNRTRFYPYGCHRSNSHYLAMTNLLLKKGMGVHVIPSLLYSSCSDLSHGMLSTAKTKYEREQNLPKSQLDEDLLKLFVDVINTELLESVILENLEPIDIKHAHAQHTLAVDSRFRLRGV
jgi:hypothetical protein